VKELLFPLLPIHHTDPAAALQERQSADFVGNEFRPIREG